jgi:hypothetical protein
MGHERAHAEFLGQSEGLLVVGYGGLALRGIAPRYNVAEQAQSILLLAVVYSPKTSVENSPR